jgi:hypothetical protein
MLDAAVGSRDEVVLVKYNQTFFSKNSNKAQWVKLAFHFQNLLCSIFDHCGWI